MKVEKFFSASDLKAIEQAVRETEKKTSGEIVTYFRPASDDYEETIWKGFIAGFLIPVIAQVILKTLPHWIEIPSEMVIPASLGCGILCAFFVFFFPPLRRLFAGRAKMRQMTQLRATEAFLANEVFKTRSRSGILIFLSLFERKVILLADSGIHSKVQQSDWDRITSALTDLIRQNKKTEALIKAVAMCGDLLVSRGFQAGPGDVNELGDQLRS